MNRQTSEEHIAENFEELLEKKSYESITVSEISKYSGISRTTFYRYFKDKSDLVDWIYKRDIREIIDRNPEGYQWKQLVLECLRLAVRKKALFRLAAVYYEQNSLFETIYESGYVYCRDIILRTTKQDVLPENLEFSVRMYSSACASLQRIWIAGGMKEPPEKMAAYLCENMPVPLQPYFRPQENRAE